MEEFQVCFRCLGEDEYTKMTREENGLECKKCSKTFNVFRWRSNKIVGRSMKTLLCKECAKKQNCCQHCMMDINIGISVEDRDTALAVGEIKLDKYVEMINGVFERRGDGKTVVSELCEKIGEQQKRTRKKPKSFVRHVNDSGVFFKKEQISSILSEYPFSGLIDPQKNPDLNSFFIFGITNEIPQYAIINYFEKFGRLKNTTIVHRGRCGYVVFRDRVSAVLFAENVLKIGISPNPATPGIIVIDEKHPLRVCFGRFKSIDTGFEELNKLRLVVKSVLIQMLQKDNLFVSKNGLDLGYNKDSSSFNKFLPYKALDPNYEL